MNTWLSVIMLKCFIILFVFIAKNVHYLYMRIFYLHLFLLSFLYIISRWIFKNYLKCTSTSGWRSRRGQRPWNMEPVCFLNSSRFLRSRSTTNVIRRAGSRTEIENNCSETFNTFNNLEVKNVKTARLDTLNVIAQSHKNKLWFLCNNFREIRKEPFHTEFKLLGQDGSVTQEPPK